MTNNNDSVSLIMEKFPEHAAEIMELSKGNSDFQTICEDYHQCAEALRHWNHSSAKEAMARRQEYQLLFQGLEDEILQCLLKST